MTESMIVEAIASMQRANLQSPMVAPTTQVADPAAVARFEAAMAPEPVETVPFADEVSASWLSAQENRQGIVHRIKALTEMSGSHALSAGELSELQYEIHNLSFQQTVVAKVADKASSAVQTLIRNQ